LRIVRPLADADRRRLAKLVQDAWGSTQVATRGRLVDGSALPGFLAQDDEDWLGYATYEIIVEALEVTAIESLKPGRGVGGALLAACVRVALERHLHRLWLITTNDNLPAIRFYQSHGLVLVAVHRDAVTRARSELKPEIPITGVHGIPIRDEIELELPRAEWRDFVERYGWPST
jgi:GNAT superfamily N-acetyltransferase